MASSSLSNVSGALRAVHFSYTMQGQHVQGSVSKHGLTKDKTPPPLTYIDIIPRLMDLGKTTANRQPIYDNYSTLLEVANQWLSMNRKFIAVRCETIQRRMETIDVTDDQRMLIESTTGFKVFIRGLRLWLTKNPYPNSPPQEIGILTKVPKKSKSHIGPTLTYRAHKDEARIVGVDHPFWLKELSSEIITFEGFVKTLERLNDDLKENPIPGSVLNIDIVTHSCQLLPTESDLDTERTYWYENDINQRRCVKILRLFYTIGPSTYEKIGTEVFSPDVIRTRKGLNPTIFTKSFHTFHKITKWMTEQPGKQLITVQSLNTRYAEKEGDYEIFTDSVDDYGTPQQANLYVETARVFYTMSSWNPPSSPPGIISWRTFVPVRLDKMQFETMSQTMYRIEAWLRVTGMPVLYVETLPYSFNDAIEMGVELEKSNIPVYSKSDRTMLTVIRIYFPYPFKEPLTEFLPKSFPWTPLKGNRSHLYHARRSFYSGLFSSRILNEPSLEDITSVNVAYHIQTKKSPHIFFDQM